MCGDELSPNRSNVSDANSQTPRSAEMLARFERFDFDKMKDQLLSRQRLLVPVARSLAVRSS